jgi:predicted RNase H-like nuclease (RuvC/YqgF family)
MTLVAEGLCEDQTKLRREVDGLMTQEDKRIQKLESTINLLETSLEEERKNHDQDVTELRNRVSQLEKQAKVTAKDKKKSRTIIRDLTWLVGIAAAAWVVVTIINAFCK